MFTACINRHYGYKDIYGYIYLVWIDQIKRVIRIYNIRFYKDNFDIKDSLKKIYKIIFDEINEKKRGQCPNIYPTIIAD